MQVARVGWEIQLQQQQQQNVSLAATTCTHKSLIRKRTASDVMDECDNYLYDS